VGLLQLVRQGLERMTLTRQQDESAAIGGEAFCQFKANAGRGSSNQDGFGAHKETRDSLNRQRQKAMSERADNLRPPDRGPNLLVLMAVKKEPGPCTGDIIAKSGKSDVDFILPVVDEPGRVMGHANINRWKRGHQLFSLILLEKEVSPGFILPGAAATSKSESPEVCRCQVEVVDGATHTGRLKCLSKASSGTRRGLVPSQTTCWRSCASSRLVIYRLLQNKVYLRPRNFALANDGPTCPPIQNQKPAFGPQQKEQSEGVNYETDT
jgi:hypothetical protein